MFYLTNKKQSFDIKLKIIKLCDIMLFKAIKNIGLALNTILNKNKDLVVHFLGITNSVKGPISPIGIL